MNYPELHHLCLRGEGLHTEFKTKVVYPLKILKEIVAFANTEGGWLFIGVLDDGQIKGVKHPDEERFVMERAIKKHISPEIDYRLSLIPLRYTGRQVLAFYIEPSKRTPVYLEPTLNPEERRCYVRIEDRSVQASREMRQILKRKHKQGRILIQYGEKEKVLLAYLAEKQRITVKKFAEVAQIPRRIASGTLIHLVLGNVLRAIPREGAEDYFEQILE